MMEAIPFQGKKWLQSNDIIVLPLTIDQYWDAFWDNDAPYYIKALERNPQDIFISQSFWGPPSKEYEI